MLKQKLVRIWRPFGSEGQLTECPTLLDSARQLKKGEFHRAPTIRPCLVIFRRNLWLEDAARGGGASVLLVASCSGALTGRCGIISLSALWSCLVATGVLPCTMWRHQGFLLPSWGFSNHIWSPFIPSCNLVSGDFWGLNWTWLRLRPGHWIPFSCN